MRDYKKLFKAIRPFVNFNHDLRKDFDKLSPSDKRRITKNYNIIRPLLSRNNHVYRPRGKNAVKNLKAAQTFGQHSKFSKDIKVALIPTDGEKGTRVTVKGNQVTVKSRNITTQTLLFDPAQLATRPQEHATELAKESGAKRFHIRTGEFAISNSFTANLVGREVAKLVARYQQGGAKYKATLTPSGRVVWDNHYNNWLTGLTASNFTNQDEFDEYQIKRFPTKGQRNKKKRKKSKTRKRKK